MAQLLLSSSLLANSVDTQLQQALQMVEECLQNLANNSTYYHSLLQQVFTPSPTAAASLQTSLSAGGLQIPLEILYPNSDFSGINSVNGAYTSAAPDGGERIYLNGAWLQSATAAEIEAVLLEELGHAIDHQLNGAKDSPGDEGEIFSALLRGQQPAASAATENDQRLIGINGITVAIEAAQDPQVSVTAIANGNETDGSTTVFRFSRTGSTTAPLSVSYRLLGTAQAGSDYSGATTGTINFSAGSATAELSLPALADSLVDPGETIIAQIVLSPTAPASYSITPGQQTATATITAEGMVVTVNGSSWSGGGWSKGEVRNARAFAALKSDGTVVCWGDPGYGGTAPDGLDGVTQIFSNYQSFAALKSDGTVVCWGGYFNGGRTIAGLVDVTQIFSFELEFQALKSNGAFVTWSDGFGGATPDWYLAGVTQIFSNGLAFAALKSDGTVISWGISANYEYTAPAGLGGVSQIFSTNGAFAALKSDGTVVCWGEAVRGGTTPAGLSGVTQIFSTKNAFAALKSDGTVVGWGDNSINGGAPSGLGGVTQIFSNGWAFAALKSDGTVVCWGWSEFGGRTPAGLGGVTQIFSTERAFAALKRDGTVVCWGDPFYGGTAPEGLGGVTQIFSNKLDFAALKSDGTVVSWGKYVDGNNRWASITTPPGLGGVTQIFSNDWAFVALKSDGTVVSWGSDWAGGTAPAGLSDVVGFANPFTDDRLLSPQPLPFITLSVTPASVSEQGETNLTYTFSRNGSLSNALTVNYTVAGSAIPGSDYTGIATIDSIKSITFAVGSAIATVAVDPAADEEIEFDETVILTLANGVGYSIGSSGPVLGTIASSDTVLVISAADASKSEGDWDSIAYTFTVSRSGDQSGSSSAAWSVSSSQATGDDFTGGIMPSGSVTFGPGIAEQTITVWVNGDTHGEGDESFTVTLSDPLDTNIVTYIAKGTIFNDDWIEPTVIGIFGSDAWKAEGNIGSSPYTFTAYRYGDLSGTTRADWYVRSSQASGNDFTEGALPSGTVTFDPGITQETITVWVNGDTTWENDEYFDVYLGSADAIIENFSAQGAILNDDEALPPAPSLLLLSDTGSSNSDRLTNNGTITVGDLEADASWEYSTDAGASWQAVAGTSLTDRHIPENPCNSMGLKSLGGRGAMGAWGCETKPIPRGSPDPTPS